MRSLRESQFFGLLEHPLAMRIQLCLEPLNLFVLSSDQRCELLLMRTNQIEQRVSDRVHLDPEEARDPWTQYATTSTKAQPWKTRINTGES